MNRGTTQSLRRSPCSSAAALPSGACSAGDAKAKEQTSRGAGRAACRAVAATEQPIARFIRATGIADGRGTGRRRGRDRRPRRRGEHRARHAGVARAPSSIRISSTETDAQLKEAEANAAQLEARLGITGGGGVRRQRGSRGAEREGALRSRAERSSRASSRCSISASCRSRNTTSAGPRRKRRASSTRRRRTARRSSIRCCRRRARASRSRARPSPTPSVRAPFNGVVAAAPGHRRRLRDQGHEGGDRRPREPAARAADGPRAVRCPSMAPSASRSPSRWTRIPGASSRAESKYVSPALQADQRALTVEAIVPNAERRAQAGPVRDGAHRAAGAHAGRADPARRVD